jgi:hypothetical protein
LHHLRDGLAVGDILASNEHIGDVTLDSHFKEVIAEEPQQGVKVVGMGVVDDKKEDYRHKHQYRHTDGALTLVDEWQQVNQQKADDLLVHGFDRFDFDWQTLQPVARGRQPHQTKAQATQNQRCQ